MPNEAEARIRHPKSSFAQEQAFKLVGEFTKAFVSSPCDPVLGCKVTLLVSHLRILNIGSRAGAEISGGDLQEGLEGFGLAVREKRRGEAMALVPTPRHEGKLLPR